MLKVIFEVITVLSAIAQIGIFTYVCLVAVDIFKDYYKNKSKDVIGSVDNNDSDITLDDALNNLKKVCDDIGQACDRVLEDKK